MRFPATSANLGPAFDTAAVALSLALDVKAAPAKDFSIRATGRDTAACSDVQNSLILKTYRETLHKNSIKPTPIAVELHNEIPLGMGLGSSAAARLAGILLAIKFGPLPWQIAQILNESIRLEGHPDNAVACALGGFTVATQSAFARFSPPPDWQALLVLQDCALATGEARDALPATYPQADAIRNVQAASLLVAAFAQQRPDLLRTAMQDTLHQPYRTHLCPLLPALAEMEDFPGVHGLALSGAGPGVILIVDKSASPHALQAEAARLTKTLTSVEIIPCDLAAFGCLDFPVLADKSMITRLIT